MYFNLLELLKYLIHIQGKEKKVREKGENHN